MATFGLTSESQVRAQAKYDATHTVRLSLKLNIYTDQDILKWLSHQESKQGAIKRLIRAEIDRDRQEQAE